MKVICSRLFRGQDEVESKNGNQLGKERLIDYDTRIYENDRHEMEQGEFRKVEQKEAEAQEESHV